MKIKTSPEATTALRNITAFCRQQWGIKTAHEIIENYQKNKKRLSSNPYMAQAEPLLTNREYAYRGLVIHKYCKVIYRIDKNTDTIYIVDVWDTRREPTRLTDNIQ